MLKALELIGFKSFADRTRFEFPPGITTVVGPNGSGKSNIVDAIKWVLGEQSVKSLRGQEMADVIFNGSGTRRPMNMAEITLTLDNSQHLLPIDTPEVHITRRVYRGGEGEYLINRAPARLRDIRDLISGTGLGAQAYSVIEQGKVDALLQASSRDRRVIFEEAAGISRFKAKKLEALRRLERVEQNLLRLSDIVEEVESRLRSVRMQAGKARRYKEYTDRLQQLRTQAALVDWCRLGDRLSEFEERLEAMQGQRDALAAELEAAEARLLETDTRISDVNEAIRASEARNAANRERIAAAESTIEHERRRGRDLEQQVERHRRRLVELSAREGDLRQQVQDTVDQLQHAEAEHQRVAMELAERERALTELTARVDRLRSETQQLRQTHLDQVRAAAELGNRIGGLESRLAAAEATGARAQERLARLREQCEQTAHEHRRLEAEHQQLLEGLEQCRGRLDAARQQVDACRRDLGARQEDLAALRQQHGGLGERAAVLEELQQRREGLSSGVKQVLAQARDNPDGPFGGVCGLVADLLTVSLEIAPLVDVALGPIAQYVVMEADRGLREYLVRQSPQFAGRVGFVWSDETEPPGAEVDLEGQTGVLGRADRFVETEPRFAALARRLLGRTWIVERLAHALRLAGAHAGPLRFVTLAGELVSDGMIVVGPRQAAAGLVARRSQLQALRTQLAELNRRIEAARERTDQADERLRAAQAQVDAHTAAHERLHDALGEHRLGLTAAAERRSQLQQQQSVLESESRAAEAEQQQAAAELEQATAQHQRRETELAELEARIDELDGRLEQLELARKQAAALATQTRVELAKSEERLRNLQIRLHQFEETREERRRALADSREQLGECVRRAEQARWNILRTESEVAELYLRKEKLARQTVRLIERREELRRRRNELAETTQQTRARIRKLEEQLHALELEAGQLQHERRTLAGRVREDYGVELAHMEHEPTPQERHLRDETQQEIDDLRRKINNLGNVNLDALEELEQLEGRYGHLAAQYRDLCDAKAALEKIIERINTDSRRLFSQTLESVRGHFQTLFRDLFGGGHADIMLEDEADILESGIEIVARPPGKEPRSISLLSGGEKTLTCVALLLAIFRSRPSPFCVLDEVDAALDEPNIDRFIHVLKGFLAWTQFIIVTHSKRTMTCADTLYGVTMQESGVSRQVSVRFEDVSEDGEISPERLREAGLAAEAAAAAANEQDSAQDSDDESQAA